MDPAVGQLESDGVLLKKSRDVGRFFVKSHFGTSLTNNRLKLNFVEASFLQSEGKLRIFTQDAGELSFEDFFSYCAKKIPDFETLFFSFRDLRNRGYAIVEENNTTATSFVEYKTQRQQEAQEPRFHVLSIAERSNFDVEKIYTLLDKTVQKDNPLWFSLVDEEGDITYYDVGELKAQGKINTNITTPHQGMILNNRVVIFEKQANTTLFEPHFLGKPFAQGLQLSHVEALYLVKKGLLSVHNLKGKTLEYQDYLQLVQKVQTDITLRLHVYETLKEKGLIVKTGFKFGTHFRVYTDMPGKTHAEYLVQAVPQGYTNAWNVVGRAIRLAHSVNKEMVFARIDDQDQVCFISFRRLRP